MPFSCRFFSEWSAPPITAIADIRVGPWHATVERETTVYPGRTTDYFVHLRAEGDNVASFEQATLRFAPANRENPEGTELSGALKTMSAALPTPENVGTVRHLVLTVEGWLGRNHLPGKTAGPAAPWTFFGMVGLHAMLSFGLVGGWLAYDRRPPPTPSTRSSDEASPSTMADLPTPS